MARDLDDARELKLKKRLREKGKDLGRWLIRGSQHTDVIHSRHKMTFFLNFSFGITVHLYNKKRIHPEFFFCFQALPKHCQRHNGPEG